MSERLPYVVIVSDGVSIRTLHAPSFGTDLPALEAIIARALDLSAPAKAPRPVPPPAAHPATLTQREMATTSGYTGNSCASCGSFQMKRSGTCETCEGCGSTSGGCS